MLNLVALIVALSSMAGAKSGGMDVYPVQKISVKGVKQIKITGVKGTLKLHGDRRAKFLSLKVQHSKSRKYDDWHLEVERRGDILVLEVFNTAYGKQWRNQVREELWPEFDIELSGPSLPAVVGWREGSLSFTDWDAGLEVSFLKGKTAVSGGRGTLKLQPVEATVEVRDRIGNTSIEGETGSVHLEHLHGDLNLNWVNGHVSVENCQGKTHIESRGGELSIAGGRGELQLQMGQGQAQIDSFKGTVHAKGDAASWDVTASAPADVNITSTSGPVEMQWNSGGAKVFLTSTRGTIRFPSHGFLRIGDREGRKVVEGVKKAKAMGQVFIRTESGSIHWQEG